VSCWTARAVRLGALAALAIAAATAGAQTSASSATTLPIDLPTALALADERNLDIAIFLARVDEASARLVQARLLAVPTLRVGSDYDRHRGNLQETSGNVLDVDRVSRFDRAAAGLGVNIADAIFRPLVARQNHAAVVAAASANRHQVLVQVAAAYLRLVHARRRQQIVDAALGRALELATLTADYAEAGEGLPADAEMAAVQPLLWQQREAAAVETVVAATAELVRLLHLESDVRLEPLDDQVPMLEIFSGEEDLEQLVARALDDRPESEQLAALTAAAEDDLTAERYRFFIPSVSVSYGTGNFGGAPGSSVGDLAHRDDLALTLYWQLDNFGLGNRARKEEKSAQLRQIALQHDRLHDAIVAEVREGYAGVQSMARQIGHAASAVERARTAYELNRSRIYDQQGLPLEVLQAMQTLATAELAELDTRMGYSLAQIRLHTALGSPLGSL
jgi:outer membrane protein TolC